MGLILLALEEDIFSWLGKAMPFITSTIDKAEDNKKGIFFSSLIGLLCDYVPEIQEDEVCSVSRDEKGSWQQFS